MRAENCSLIWERARFLFVEVNRGGDEVSNSVIQKDKIGGPQ